jgi:hypothetical protein
MALIMLRNHPLYRFGKYKGFGEKSILRAVLEALWPSLHFSPVGKPLAKQRDFGGNCACTIPAPERNWRSEKDSNRWYGIECD